jgi:hypothetical protein
VVHAPVEKKIIDHGEKVQVKEHHHLHHVVQPVIEKETHERHRIHTTIPIHRKPPIYVANRDQCNRHDVKCFLILYALLSLPDVTHEAPIIQQSINHEPLQMDEFLKRGGSLSSGLTHSEIGQTLLTERRASIVANVPIQSVAATSSTAELETDLSKKLNI